MDKYFQVWILTIIFSLMFFGIIFMLFLRLKNIADRKQKEFEKMLNNDETKNDALLILNKRENRFKKAMVFLKYYIPLLGLLFISLGIYMSYIEIIKDKNYSVKIIVYIFIVIIGIYYFFTGFKEMVSEYIYKKNLICDGDNYKILLINGNDKLHGNIKIISRNKYIIYISWNIYDEQNNNICGCSLPIYFKEEDRIENKVLKKIIEKIKKYRVGRKKYFEKYIITIL